MNQRRQWKNRGLKALTTTVVLVLSLIILPFSASAANQLFSVEATLSPPAPVLVSVGFPISATVTFGTSFSSIEQVCFVFHFQEDLLDSGETLFFGPFIMGSGFGFINNSPNPLSDRTSCITTAHAESSLFLDGEQTFGVTMDVGSVILGSLTVQITGMPTATSVDIDIKPGSDFNSINPKSKGKISVAIVTTADFDASTVDPLSVHFGLDGATEGHGKGHIVDADGDGDLDLVLHFKTQDAGIQCGDTEVSLTGETFGGQMIVGTDSIITVGCK